MSHKSQLRIYKGMVILLALVVKYCIKYRLVFTWATTFSHAYISIMWYHEHVYQIKTYLYSWVRIGIDR